MRKSAKGFLLAAIILLCGTAAPVLGADAMAIASSVSGDAKFQRSGSGELIFLTVGQQFFQGDVIYTFTDGRVALVFSDGSVYSIHPESRLSLAMVPGAGQSSMLSSLTGNIAGGLKDMFAASGKRESLTAVPGFRKPGTQKQAAGHVRILYPRNSMVMEKRPEIRWKGPAKGVTVTLTLKEPLGKVWSLTANESTVPYPKGQPELASGQTYFLKIENRLGADTKEEIYFSLLGDQEGQAVKDLAEKLRNHRKSNPHDTTASMLLTELYIDKRLFHQALAELNILQRDPSARVYALKKKQSIYREIGLWQEWENAGRKLTAAASE